MINYLKEDITHKVSYEGINYYFVERDYALNDFLYTLSWNISMQKYLNPSKLSNDDIERYFLSHGD